MALCALRYIIGGNVMEYRGFEFYATEVPGSGSVHGSGKVFACEIYAADDVGMANVLDVFNLVEGKDIPANCEEALINALRVHIDKNFESLSEHVKAEAFVLLRSLDEIQNRPGYRIAEAMAFLQNTVESDVPLSDEEAYVLASKFEEARGSWFGTTVLHAEYLEALRDLLESGVNERNVPDFPELTPADTLKLLLIADNQVFGTLVEAATVESYYRHWPHDYKLDPENRQAVFRAAGQVKFPVHNVSEVISQAVEKAENGTSEKGKGFERVMD